MLYELTPRYTNNQSFYGKAFIIQADGKTYLRSYETIVCFIDENNTPHRTWSGFSKTTGRHITDFFKQHGINFDGKKTWDAMKIENEPTVTITI